MATLVMEVGKIFVSGNVNSFTHLTFKNSYNNPVVIAYMMSYNGEDPAVVRVCNVTDEACDFFIEEDLGGAHTSEWASYIVIEAGYYTLPGGQKIAAGTIDIPSTSLHSLSQDPNITGNYTQLTFDNAFASDPAFFAALNTYNNGDFMAAGTFDVTTTGAKLFQEKSRVSTTVANEVFGWFAIDKYTTGTIPGASFFEVGKFNDGSADGRRDTTPHLITYTGTYVEPPIILVHGNTINGFDGYWTRAKSWGLYSSEVIAEEGGTSAGEIHTDETFSHIIFDFDFDIIYEVETGDLLEKVPANIWVHDQLIFKPGPENLSIFDLTSEALINLIPSNVELTSVWANDQYVYVGTTRSGVYTCPTSTVTGTANFTEYKSYPDITANHVNYLHGAGNYLCIATVSGVDRYNTSTDDREYTLVENPAKCFQTTDGSYYYYTNSNLKIVDLDGDLFHWAYTRVVELSEPTKFSDTQLFIEIPLTEPDLILTQANRDGSDVRFVDNYGNVLPYYTEMWNGIDAPQYYVRLTKGVDKVYILYGNRYIPASNSSAEATFKLFDHFDESELDTDMWTFYSQSDYGSNTYSINNSILTFDSYNNSYAIGLRSNQAFSSCSVDVYCRRTTNTYTDDMDLTMYFEGGGTGAYLGVADNGVDEFPLYLISNSSQGNVYGTKFLSTAFKRWTIEESLYYQSTEYDDELLLSSGTLNSVSYRPVFISYHSWYNRPDLKIDWIRIRSSSFVSPDYVVGRGQYTRDVFSVAKLYSVYGTTGSGFTYTSEPDNVLKSNYLNDLHVTEGTSPDGGNTIFLATAWGASVIAEKRGDELNSTQRIYLIDA
jgi:hypothetical protein